MGKHRSNSRSKQKPEWNNSEELVIDDEEGSNKLHVKTIKNHNHNHHKPQKRSTSTNSRKKPLGKNIYDDRPAFNLDTRIDGYDDVDENGRYKRQGPSQNDHTNERKKQQVHQEELNEQWASSLRDNFYVH
ncbi:hypothetical protein FO519_005680 [Halicephalobus sp. NKZ332]|nr:hypothetical protein FO519_005680 [Halicephalobus sp. NKZ332]